MASMLRKNEAALLFAAMILAVAGLMLLLQGPHTLGFFSIFLAGDSVTRSFSSANPVAGSTLTVYLTVDVGTAGYYALEDRLPSGWTVVPGSTNMYTDQAGVVKWLVYSGPVDTTLSYQTVVPAGASGSYTFSGTYIFEGGSTTDIGGASAINVGGTDSTPPVISGVSAVVSDAGTSATVSWVTDEDSNSKVEFGLSALYGQQVSSATREPSHVLNLSSLQSGKTYHYKVTSADAAGNSATSSDSTFTMPPLCPEGGISGACVCGGTTKSTGSCCSDSWQSGSSCSSAPPPPPAPPPEPTPPSGGGGGGGSSIYYAADRDGDGAGDCPGSTDRNEAEKATATVNQEVTESVMLKKNLPYHRYVIHGGTGITTVYYTAGTDCDCNPNLKFVGICRNNTVCVRGSCVPAGAGGAGGDLITGLGGADGSVKTIIFSESFETSATPEEIRLILGEAGYGEAEIRYAEAASRMLKFSRKVEVFKITGLEGNESRSSIVTISAKNEGGTNFSDIVALEKVPKSAAQNISEIYSDFAFNTYVDDPVIEFPLGDMNAGGEAAVSYSVRRGISETYLEFLPPVALSLTETIPPACECGDYNPCTTDGCGPGGVCEYSALMDGTKCGEGAACVKGACTAGSHGMLPENLGLLAIALAVLMLIALAAGIVLRHGGERDGGRGAAPIRAGGAKPAGRRTQGAAKAGGMQGGSGAAKAGGMQGGVEIIEEDA